MILQVEMLNAEVKNVLSAGDKLQPYYDIFYLLHVNMIKMNVYICLN